MNANRSRGIRLAIAMLLAASSCVLAGEPARATPPGETKRAEPGDTPRSGSRLKEQRAKRQQLEKELKKLRAEYFRAARPAKERQIGIAKLREYTDPETYQLLFDTFAGEPWETRVVLMDHFADLANEDADLALSWMGVFGGDQQTRDAARQRLDKRVAAVGSAPENTKLIIYQGLTRGDEDQKKAAAALANGLSVIDAIPWLIATQVSAGGGPGAAPAGNTQQGDLAWIMVGTQTAYVADLQPVVSDGAVAFDPELATISEGTLIRILGATVITYRTEIRTALVDLSTRAWGKPTDHLGWDVAKWRDWHVNEFLPYWKAKQEEAARKKAEEEKRARTPERR